MELVKHISEHEALGFPTEEPVETDPVFLASEAASFVTGDKANLDNQSGVNTGDQDLSGKVDKITNYSLVADTEIAKIHAAGSDDQDLSPYLKHNGTVALSGNLDFSKFMATALVCDTGTGFPASPATAQWFYRSDIKTIFTYEGGWKAIQSFGAVTLYVDGTSGTDAVGQGYSSGAGATKTIQYAIDLIPPINGGNVIISVAGGSYTEALKLQGKAYSGPYSITIEGTLPAPSDTGTIVSATQYTMGPAGTGVTQATIIDTSKSWAVGAIVLGTDGADYICIKAHTAEAQNRPVNGTATIWKYYWLYYGTRGTGATWVTGTAYTASEVVNKLVVITGGTGAGQERVVDFNRSATALTIVGLWDTIPSTDSTYSIYDLSQGTVLDGSSLGATQYTVELNGQPSIYFKYLYFTEAPLMFIYAHDFSSFGIESCVLYRDRISPINIRSITVENFSSVIYAYSTVTIENRATAFNSSFILTQSTGVDFRNCKFQGGNANFPASVGVYVSLHGCVFRNARANCFQFGQYSRMDLNGTVFYNGASGISMNTGAALVLGSVVKKLPFNTSEVSLCSSHGVIVNQHAVATLNGMQINYNNGWGVNTTLMSIGIGASAASYTGNTSGTYTNDATSVNT